ncbi:putative membrane protein [Moraxella catarrhalis BBH18]|nr:putative membrane protein [Moraxella catarrhalis BBH18]
MVSLLFNFGHVIISLLVSFALSSDDGAFFMAYWRTVLVVFFMLI